MLAGAEGSLRLVITILLPSGDQSGYWPCLPHDVNCRSPVPSDRTTKAATRSVRRTPFLRRSNAIHWPSGDHRGSPSNHPYGFAVTCDRMAPVVASMM